MRGLHEHARGELTCLSSKCELWLVKTMACIDFTIHIWHFEDTPVSLYARPLLLLPTPLLHTRIIFLHALLPLCTTPPLSRKAHVCPHCAVLRWAVL